jgi:hypothetical protein
MPSKALAGGIAVIGLLLMIICASLTSKYNDKKSSTYKGLVTGSVIGGIMIIIGIAMFAFEGGGGNGGGNKSAGTSPSNVAGSDLTKGATGGLTSMIENAKNTSNKAAAEIKNSMDIEKGANEAVKELSKLKGFMQGVLGG